MTGAQAEILLPAQQEIEVLRQQLQHFRDQEAQRERRFFGSATAFHVDVYGTALNYGGDVAPLPDPGAWRRQEEEQTAALMRALDLLEVKLGAEAVAKIQAGGAYPVGSRFWPNVTYLIPKEPHQRIQVVADGSLVTESCLVTTDYSLPWPDVMLHRITAVELDESVLFATGVLHEMKKGKWKDKLKKLFRRA